MKKIVLFGAGSYGLLALERFGRENIYAFCDNACYETTNTHGVLCLPFSKLLEIIDDIILIITVNAEKTHKIIYQLKNNNIDDFLVYDSVLLSKWNEDPVFFFRNINDDLIRFQLEREQFYMKYTEISMELKSLKRITDITKLKPAEGYMGKHQSNLAEFAKEVLYTIKELKIKPFLCGGSLLGYYRHGDYIPWDDDLDFGLLREDYMKLLQYGKNNFIYLEQMAGINDEDNERLIKTYNTHPNEFIMVLSPRCMQIKKGTSEIDALTLDFFSYDFYDDKYKFENLKKTVELYRKDYIYKECGNNKILENIDANHLISKHKTSNVYFGFDNMDMYEYHNTNWMDADDFFPLKKIVFHGIPCYIQNSPQKLLPFYYKSSYMDFPESIVCKHWAENILLRLKDNYISCGIRIQKDEDSYRFLTMYSWMRENGIYAVYYINLGEDELEKSVVDSCAEYVQTKDDDFDIIYKDGMFIKDEIFVNFSEVGNVYELENALTNIIIKSNMSKIKKVNCKFIGGILN